jgi:hypothetical protein
MVVVCSKGGGVEVDGDGALQGSQSLGQQRQHDDDQELEEEDGGGTL